MSTQSAPPPPPHMRIPLQYDTPNIDPSSCLAMPLRCDCFINTGYSSATDQLVDQFYNLSLTSQLGGGGAGAGWCNYEVNVTGTAAGDCGVYVTTCPLCYLRGHHLIDCPHVKYQLTHLYLSS